MTTEYIFFLGRQALLSACEAWSFCKQWQPTVQYGNDRVVVIQTEQEIPFPSLAHLGGCDRVGRVVGTYPTKPTVQDILAALSPIPGARIAFGLSTFGDLGFDRKFLVAIKKEARQREVRISFIEPNKKGEHQLSSAQVLFNGLYREPNAEVTVLPIRDAWLLVHTVWVQDIQAYERRDTSRPVRDPRVGMLPPKLAQIMINVTSANLASNAALYDPFCGVGTILQEGALMGRPMIGSDSSKEMVAASQQNVAAVSPAAAVEIFQHDVYSPFPSRLRGKVEGMVTEPWLGTPLTSPLSLARGEKYIAGLLPLYRAFFQHAASILPAGSPLLCIFPRVRTTKGWVAIPSSFIDEIARFGYHLEHLVPAVLQPYFGSDQTVLVYHRPDALVGRDLRLWTRM